MTRFAQVPITFTLAPHSDEDTSRDAAKAITPHLERLERRVLDALAENGPMTDQEIERATGLSGNTARPRRVALCGRGLVVDSGERRKASRRPAKVWRRA